MVDVIQDVPQHDYEDQIDDFREEDLNDPDMKAYMQDCYKAYKTDSTPKRPPLKNPKSGPDGKPLPKLLDISPSHIAVIMAGKSTTSGKPRKINKLSWCLSGDDVETFIHHLWEEEPTPEPDGLPNGLLVNTDKITYIVYPTRSSSTRNLWP